MWSALPRDVVESHIIHCLSETSARALQTTCREEHQRFSSEARLLQVLNLGLRFRRWSRGVKDWSLVARLVQRLPDTLEVLLNEIFWPFYLLCQIDSPAFIRAVLIGPRGPSSDWRWRNLYILSLAGGDNTWWLLRVLHTEALPPGTTIRRVLETSGMPFLRSLARSHPTRPPAPVPLRAWPTEPAYRKRRFGQQRRREIGKVFDD